MSAIAGLIRTDGGTSDPAAIRRMTSAMVHRGPDGIGHWTHGAVQLGQCMLRTTPEAADEVQPWSSATGELTLVLDGRVDNPDALRGDLLSRGAVLRNRTDAELVLQAYETWGEGCADRIVGEFVFAIWDNRRKTVFAARDAAGTRNFVYFWKHGTFLFASEIKGLLALDEVPRRLNESKVLDFLVVQHDRDDVTGTFYQGILRLPAGHAMRVDAAGVKTWRYWDPANLPNLRFASMDECGEAYLEQLRVAVKCRLRSSRPVAALLSGGLDSSSIVGLIRHEFRSELAQPLKTFSLIGDDRANCPEWAAVQEMVRGGWIQSAAMAPTDAVRADTCQRFLDDVARQDDPFALVSCFPVSLALQAARQAGCVVVLEGMGGDLVSYGPDRSQKVIFRNLMLTRVPQLISALRRHGLDPKLRQLAWRFLAEWSPERVRAAYRAMRDGTTPRLHFGPEMSGDNFRRLRPEVANAFIASKKASAPPMGREVMSDQASHAEFFTSGLLSFAHEIEGDTALAMGLEQRSPFSDRRLIEFAVRMPVEAKLFATWYKLMQRNAMRTILPDKVTWRSDIGQHPGWMFHDSLLHEMGRTSPGLLEPSAVQAALGSWIDADNLKRAFASYAQTGDSVLGYNLWSLGMLTSGYIVSFSFIQYHIVTFRFPKMIPVIPPLPALKKPYASPKLTTYGEVRELTQTQSSGSNEGFPGAGIQKPGL